MSCIFDTKFAELRLNATVRGWNRSMPRLQHQELVLTKPKTLVATVTATPRSKKRDRESCRAAEGPARRTSTVPRTWCNAIVWHRHHADAATLAGTTGLPLVRKLQNRLVGSPGSAFACTLVPQRKRQRCNAGYLYGVVGSSRRKLERMFKVQMWAAACMVIFETWNEGRINQSCSRECLVV